METGKNGVNVGGLGEGNGAHVTVSSDLDSEEPVNRAQVGEGVAFVEPGLIISNKV